MTLFAIITGIPILLTGAAVVGLPVLLHLIMRQEPKRMPFPAFRFLKQKRQINQRKIRLRHLLLLLLRMALIALICLSLWQPTILSEGFSLHGGRPIAAVVVIDTSPSMGYVLSERTGLTEARQHRLKLLDEPADGPWTCLDESRGLAMEILEDLPPGSKVAVLDTADRGEPVFEGGLAEARQRVKDIKKPRGNSQPVTRTLESAYSLLTRVDLELEPGQEPYPRLLVIFSDRTVPSWDQNRMAELQSLRDRVPPPSVFHAYVDVGIEKPVNTAITTIEMKPQIVPANQPVLINVTVEATGGSSENLLVWSIDGEEQPQRNSVNPSQDRPVTRQLRKDGLRPGLHHAKISLITPDALPFDNERSITFRVREPRNVLALVDLPGESLLTGALGVQGTADAKARAWKRALESVGWYSCDVKPADDPERIDWSKYEQVTLLDVTKPSAALWAKLEEFGRRGGHIIVTPGGPEMDVTAYQTEAAANVLPRKFTKWFNMPDREIATWTWDALNSSKPLVALFRQYRAQNDFFVNTPPFSYGFWKVEDGGRERMVVAYNDSPDPDTRSPAVLEWTLGGRGKVYQFTVPFALGSQNIHNYASTWFYLVLVNEAVRTQTGDSEDQLFNFATGQNVLIKWPPGEVKPGTTYIFSGPDVSASDATVTRDASQAFFRLGPEKTVSAGPFTLTAEDGKWSDGFSLNVPVEESNLERLPPESIQELLGEDTIFTADKKLPLKEILSGKFTQPIELFPFLMILLLLVLALENWMGNKFYRRKRRRRVSGDTKMPIHDWTRVDAGAFHDFHNMWLIALRHALWQILPPGYYVRTEQKAIGYGPDILALAESDPPGTNGSGNGTVHSNGHGEGGIHVATAPPKAMLRRSSEVPRDEYKRRWLAVRLASGDRVVAIMEVVSPGNKGSQESLRAVTAKVAEFLERGVHVSVVDLFPPTPRDPQGIHQAIWAERAADFLLPPDKQLTLVSYVAGEKEIAYIQPVAVGEALPDLALFLSEERYVLVPLESTYAAVFQEVDPRTKRILTAPTK